MVTVSKLDCSAIEVAVETTLTTRGTWVQCLSSTIAKHREQVSLVSTVTTSVHSVHSVQRVQTVYINTFFEPPDRFPCVRYTIVFHRISCGLRISTTS